MATKVFGGNIEDLVTEVWSEQEAYCLYNL